MKSHRLWLYTTLIVLFWKASNDTDVYNNKANTDGDERRKHMRRKPGSSITAVTVAAVLLCGAMLASPAHGAITGLTNRWTFDETSGTTAFDSVGVIHGTLVGSDVVRVAGFIGPRAVKLLGNDGSFVDFTTSVGQFGIDEFTVSFWFNTTETQPLFDLLGNRTAGSHGNFFQIRMTGVHPSEPDGMIIAEIDQDGSGTNYIPLESTQVGLNDGTWHHVAVARQGTAMRLFIDGVLSASGSAAANANVANGNPFKLGRSLNDPCCPGDFTGAVSFDELRIYNRALTDSEIASLGGAVKFQLLVESDGTGSFTGTCDVGGVSKTVSVVVTSDGLDTGTATILAGVADDFVALFSGTVQRSDVVTITVDGDSATVTIPVSGTFTGSYNTATMAFPVLISSVSSPAINVVVGGATITGLSYTPTGLPAVNSVTFSTTPPFPEPGSSVIIDVTRPLALTLGGLNCALSGGTMTNTTAGLAFVVIDIKPGSFPNSINLGSAGTVPVAIFSSPSFDASTVDPATVTLAGASVALRGKGTSMASLADVNGDGLLDLIVHVDTEALQLSDGDTETLLQGETTDGAPIRGKDSVRIVP